MGFAFGNLVLVPLEAVFSKETRLVQTRTSRRRPEFYNSCVFRLDRYFVDGRFGWQFCRWPIFLNCLIRLVPISQRWLRDLHFCHQHPANLSQSSTLLLLTVSSWLLPKISEIFVYSSTSNVWKLIRGQKCQQIDPKISKLPNCLKNRKPKLSDILSSSIFRHFYLVFDLFIAVNLLSLVVKWWSYIWHCACSIYIE